MEQVQPIGVTRPVDKMGRVVIPKEIRKQLNIENDKDSFEIYMQGDMVVLKKYQPRCVFCKSLEGSIMYEGYTVCKECIAKLNKKLDKEDFE